MSIAFIILVLKESVILPLFSVFWGQCMQFLNFCILRCSTMWWYKGNLHNVIAIKVPQYWLKTSLCASFMGHSLWQDSAIALLIIYLLYVGDGTVEGSGVQTQSSHLTVFCLVHAIGLLQFQKSMRAIVCGLAYIHCFAPFPIDNFYD